MLEKHFTDQSKPAMQDCARVRSSITIVCLRKIKNTHLSNLFHVNGTVRIGDENEFILNVKKCVLVNTANVRSIAMYKLCIGQ